MPCQLCGGPDHPKGALPSAVLNCPVYAQVPQPLKDSIKQLWDDNPQTVGRGQELADWIYDHVYSPGAQQHGVWTFYFNPDYPNPLGLVEERVYLSVKGVRLLAVWAALQPGFTGTLKWDVVQAKRCQPNVADARPDSIVIYLRNKAGVWRCCDELRRLRRERAIADTDFKSTSPPGTGQVPDLPGVSEARQPDDPGDSFGGELSRILGSVFDARNRPVRVPSMLDFTTSCLAELKAQGIDITRPWNRPLQVFG
ncbi:MAG TPA: hypothetical protein VGF55_13610 [Gemmataceae bacterium]